MLRALHPRREGGVHAISVESTTGAVTIGVASLLPRLSVRGAPLATPWLRFQSPLIEPDVQISRIRLSDKASCFRPRKVACADDDGATARCAYPAPAGMALLATTHSARCRPAGSSKPTFEFSLRFHMACTSQRLKPPEFCRVAPISAPCCFLHSP